MNFILYGFVAMFILLLILIIGLTKKMQKENELLLEAIVTLNSRNVELAHLIEQCDKLQTRRTDCIVEYLGQKDEL